MGLHAPPKKRSGNNLTTQSTLNPLFALSLSDFLTCNRSPLVKVGKKLSRNEIHNDSEKHILFCEAACYQTSQTHSLAYVLHLYAIRNNKYFI